MLSLPRAIISIASGPKISAPLRISELLLKADS